MGLLLSPLALKGWAIVALLAALFGGKHFYDKHHYDLGYAAAKAEDRIAGDKTLTLRLQQNLIETDKNRETNRLITKAKDDELSSLRATIASAPKLRIGSAICGGVTRPPEATSASVSNGEDPGSRVVRGDIGRDLDALKLTVETAFATGRACQAFLLEHDLAP